MRTLSELKEESAMLKKKNMLRAKILKEKIEIKKLSRENRRLKRPGLSSAFGQIKSIAGVGAKSVGYGVKAGVKKQLEIGARESKMKRKKR